MASRITSCWRRQRRFPPPGKAHDHRGLNPGLGHGRHHLLRPHQLGLGRIVEQAEGRFIGEVILPVAADFLREDMGVTIQNHPYTMALNVQRRKPFLSAGNPRENLAFLLGTEAGLGQGGHFPLVYIAVFR